jgi:parallel beta-helix repeat protein
MARRERKSRIESGGATRDRAARAAHTAALAVALAWLVASGEAAAVQCGDTVGPGGTVVLDQDLVACPTGRPALTVVGPVTLDLGSRRISCATDAQGWSGTYGVLVVGERAQVRNGTISDCLAGVLLRGAGRHRVTSVLVERSTVEGVYVGGDRNRLTDVTVSSSHARGGFLVEGERNVLTRCTASGNAGAGFRMVGYANNVTRSVAADNLHRGFEILGEAVKLTRNLALLSREAYGSGDGDGFEVFAVRPSVVDNVATLNAGRGFDVNASGGKLTRNVASNNGRDGYRLYGDGIAFQRNEARSNQLSGVRVGGTGMRLAANTALGHPEPEFDLRDVPSCNGNVWRANVYGTKSTDCIR